MTGPQQLHVQRKREHEKREETTIPARVFVPTADIYETKDALTVILEMPGVEKNNITVRVEDGLLYVEGRLDLTKYQGNDTWVLPIPATFVVGQDGRIRGRFVDPDYRKRMAIEDLLAAMRS